MNVSVVICTCNRYESILETLESILKNTIKPLEILIIDQSDDQTRMVRIITSIDNNLIHYIHMDQKGQSIARNLGMRKSLGDIISFTDDDAYVHEDWIEQTMNTFACTEFNTGIAGGKIIPVYAQRNPNWTMPAQWEFVLPAYSQEGPMAVYSKGFPPGVNYSIKRELMQSVGFFDEKLGLISGRRNQLFGDDTNYTIRALQSGYQVVFNPKSVVYHPVPLSRQTQDFLNKRLFSKGLTDIVVQLRSKNPGKLSLLRSYARHLLKFGRLFLTGKMDRQIKEGQKWLLKGQITMLRTHLLHSDVFKSKLF